MSQTDPPAFTQFIPGFEFLQNLGRQAAAGASSGGTAVPGMPPMSHWVAPTFDVEELDKRIQDLKAVHFWLDQNTKALAATIQALEVQKMTLATLQRMNVGLGEIADAFQMRPAAEAPEPPRSFARAAPVSEPEPVPEAAAAPAPEPAAAPAVDPMQWWGALTQQFQTIATSAMQDMAAQASRAAEQAVVPVPMPSSAAASSKKARPAPRKAAASGTAAPSKRASSSPARKPRAPAAGTPVRQRGRA
jgi:hypothetical protein